MGRIKRADEFNGNIGSIHSKVDYLKKKMEEAPYHQAKQSKSTDHGFGWIYQAGYLKGLRNEKNREEVFDKIMNSKHFSEVEKDYILFNINRLKEIAEWPAWKFHQEVGVFALESAGVEVEEDES